MVEIVRSLPLELRQRVYTLLTRGEPKLPWGWRVRVDGKLFCEVHEEVAFHCWRPVEARELRSLLPAGWSGRPSRRALVAGDWCYFHAATRTPSWAWPRPRFDWVLEDPEPRRPRRDGRPRFAGRSA